MCIDAPHQYGDSGAGAWDSQYASSTNSLKNYNFQVVSRKPQEPVKNQPGFETSSINYAIDENSQLFIAPHDTMQTHTEQRRRNGESYFKWFQTSHFFE
jgi:hypothetical protein